MTPQMLVSIYGVNLASETASQSGFPLPIKLAGTSLTFNGTAAPLLFVSPHQINAQVPSSVPRGASVNVVVTTSSGASAGFAVPVSLGRVPGAFTQDGSGCGQAAALNIHGDGTMSVNTPQNSFNPGTDQGLAFFGTGFGPFADRVDGTRWQYNPANNFHMDIGIGVGGVTGLGAVLDTGLTISYAGPAPGLAGVDQINGLFYPGPPTEVTPLPEGCRIPIRIQPAGNNDFESQFVNVSIHSGGGVCVDPAATSLAIATWRQTLTSDTTGTSTASSVTVQLLQGTGIAFPMPPVTSVVSATASYGFLQPNPTFCATSYPSNLTAGTIDVAGPGFGPFALTANNQDGPLGYQGTLPLAAIQPGAYSFAAPGLGNTGVGAIAAKSNLPAPIAVTTNLKPGTGISFPFTVNWTGGDGGSVVTVLVLARIPGQQNPFELTVTTGAGDNTRTLPLPGNMTLPSGTPFEVVITQQPAASVAQPFSAIGLTLGGEQLWNYVSDFKGLTAN